MELLYRNDYFFKHIFHFYFLNISITYYLGEILLKNFYKKNMKKFFREKNKKWRNLQLLKKQKKKIKIK